PGPAFGGLVQRRDRAAVGQGLHVEVLVAFAQALEHLLEHAHVARQRVAGDRRHRTAGLDLGHAAGHVAGEHVLAQGDVDLRGRGTARGHRAHQFVELRLQLRHRLGEAAGGGGEAAHRLLAGGDLLGAGAQPRPGLGPGADLAGRAGWVKLPALAAKPLTACSLATICSALAASGVQVSVTVRIGPATPAVSPKLALSCWIAPSISALVWRNAANAPASPATASRPWLARRCEFTCRLEAAVLAPPSRAAFHPAYPVLAPKTTSVVTSAAIQKLLPRPRPLPAIVSTTVLMVLPLPCFVRS